jgi:hypothetical protein
MLKIITISKQAPAANACENSNYPVGFIQCKDFD